MQVEWLVISVCGVSEYFLMKIRMRLTTKHHYGHSNQHTLDALNK